MLRNIPHYAPQIHTLLITQPEFLFISPFAVVVCGCSYVVSTKKILSGLPASFLLKITGLQEEIFKFTGHLQEVYPIFTGELQEIFIFHRGITGFCITDFHFLIEDIASCTQCVPCSCHVRNQETGISHFSRHPQPPNPNPIIPALSDAFRLTQTNSGQTQDKLRTEDPKDLNNFSRHHHPPTLPMETFSDKFSTEDPKRRTLIIIRDTIAHPLYPGESNQRNSAENIKMNGVKSFSHTPMKRIQGTDSFREQHMVKMAIAFHLDLSSSRSNIKVSKVGISS